MKKMHKAITELDGIIFSQSLLSGFKWMSEREKLLDDINVFPVPDSDTGTNMVATVRSVISLLEDLHEPSLSKVAQIVADETLNESRGNSGAILSQFFNGFAEASVYHATLTTKQLGIILNESSFQAYQAVSDPKEGTILTVMREWSDFINSNADDTPHFSILLPRSLKYAEEILQRTKTQMEVLKNADVVDSGAQGFIYILEGVVDYIQKGYTQRSTWIASNEDESIKTNFNYSMECMLVGDSLKQTLIREELKTVSSMIVIAGSSHKFRIVLLTNYPDKVVRILRSFGSIEQETIEDLHHKKRELNSQEMSHVALVTDTACDIPDSWAKKYNIHKVPFRVNVGKDSFLDEYTISDEEFYNLLIRTGHIAKTSQPSQADFSKVYDWTTTYHKKTLSLHLSRSLSACAQAALQTSQKYAKDSILVIDSKSASVGMGLLMLYAAKLIENNIEWDVLCYQIQKLLPKVKVYFVVNDINYLIKGGRLSHNKGALAKALNIKPILYLDHTGSIVPIDKTVGLKAAKKKIFSYLQKAIQKDKKYWAAVAHANNLNLAEEYRTTLIQMLKLNIEDCEEVYISSISPTLGAHTGPNVIGIAFMELDETDIELIS